MASSYEMFLKTIRTSSPREQEELWKNFLLRAYPHERVSMLKQVLSFMDRQDPDGLRKAIREYKAEREARAAGAGSASSGSDPGRNAVPDPGRHSAASRRAVNPPWDKG